MTDIAEIAGIIYLVGIPTTAALLALDPCLDDDFAWMPLAWPVALLGLAVFGIFWLLVRAPNKLVHLAVRRYLEQSNG